MPVSTLHQVSRVRRSEERRAGWVIAAAPAVVPVLLTIHGLDASAVGMQAWVLRGLAVAIALGLLAGGLVPAHFPRAARVVFVVAALGFSVVGVLGLPDAPLASFMVGVVGVALLALTPVARPLRGTSRGHARDTAWAALFVTLGLAALIAPVDPVARGAALLPAALAAYEGRLLWRTRERWVAGALVAAAGLGVVMGWGHPGTTLLVAAAVPAGLLLMLPAAAPTSAPLRELWSAAVLEHPARLLMATFALAGVAGGVLLTIPAASTGEPLTIIDGLFTAFSAVCVTGLIVVDTPAALTGFGQAVVLLLIQLGGLGILTFTTATFLAMGSLGVRGEGIATRLLAAETPRTSLLPALLRVAAVTVAAELTGAVILSSLFIAQGDPVPAGIWRGTFTAISAYCNAGFALQTDSLMPYAQSPLVLWVSSGLLIVGGLGPAVVVAIPRWLRGRPTSLLVRVVIPTTLVLLFVPTLLFLAIEWDHALAGLSLVDRITNAWFLSATTRTAGFNSLDMTSLAPATVTVVILLMAIGGSPGSTAGGLKTTTAAVLLLASLATARGRDRLEIGRRSIPDLTVRRALAATGALMLVVGATLVFIQLTQSLSATDATFEVVSAVSTVGLSLNATGQLDGVGRVAILAVMLVGRIGPLTFLSVLMPAARPRPISRPPEDLPVG